jgi:hypothetical protein
MDKEAARELVKELTSALEDGRGRLVPIVRKASRLATLVGDHLNRTIFELHLSGLGMEIAGSGRVVALSQIEISSAIDLAAQDRRSPLKDEGVIAPLVEIERALAGLEAIPLLGRPENINDGIRSIRLVLARIANRVGTFVNNVVMLLGKMPDRGAPEATIAGKKIFIGHGGSHVWKDLRDLLKDRLGLDCIEFNTESQAGNTTCARLWEMLESSRFAFLVMTGEDAHPDGTVHARENVIHETGLFQGKLGFNKAIMILEEGCAKFSNIQGLTYIRFPKGEIKAASEDIRQVLEREELLPSSTAKGQVS